MIAACHDKVKIKWHPLKLFFRRNDVIIHFSNYSGVMRPRIFERANDFAGDDIQEKKITQERQYQPRFSSGDQARLIKKVCARGLSINHTP